MKKRMNLKNTRNKFNSLLYFISCILFSGYIIFLLWRVFFYAYGQHYRSVSKIIKYNLIPFKTITNYIIGYSRYPFNVWFFNLFGNVMAFIPLGFFVPIVFYKVKEIKHIIIIAIIVSSIIEVLQFITKLGSLDIDDIILNTLGAALGYVLYKCIEKFTEMKISK